MPGTAVSGGSLRQEKRGYGGKYIQQQLHECLISSPLSRHLAQATCFKPRAEGLLLQPRCLVACCCQNNLGTLLRLRPWHAASQPPALLRARYSCDTQLPSQKPPKQPPKRCLESVWLEMEEAECETCTDSNTGLRRRLPGCTQTLWEGSGSDPTLRERLKSQREKSFHQQALKVLF